MSRPVRAIAAGRVSVVLALVLAAGAGAFSDALITYDFEDGLDGWTSLDPACGLQATYAPEEVKSGTGALKFVYTPQAGALQAVHISGLTVIGAQSLRFWLRTTASTTVAVSVSEHDGSNYMAMFHSPASTWQSVALPLGDFILDEHSTDENGRLDDDQIGSIALLDLATFVASNPDAARLFGSGTGERTLWLDDFVISSDAVPQRTRKRSRANYTMIVLDDFEAGPLQWLALGPASIAKDTTNVPDSATALRVQYEVGKAISAVATQIAMPQEAASARAVSLQVRTDDPTAYAVLLTEEDKSTYIATFYIPDAKWHRIDIPLTAFKLDAKPQDEIAQMKPEEAATHIDENEHLDVDQVRSIQLMDLASLTGTNPEISGLFGAKAGIRWLWVDELALSSRRVPARTVVREKADGRELVLDGFESEPIAWMPHGEVAVSLVEGNAGAGEASLRLEYDTGPRRLVALMRDLQGLQTQDMTGVSFLAKSDNPTTLAISLEEPDKSRYTALVSVQASQTWREYVVELSQFALDRDSTDENGHLDPGRLRMLSIIDVSGIAAAGQSNTLWLDEILLRLR